MTQEIRSTAIGWVAGLGTAIVKNDVLVAVVTAFLTGGAAYIGQVLLKYVHLHLKHKIRELLSSKKSE